MEAEKLRQKLRLKEEDNKLILNCPDELKALFGDTPYAETLLPDAARVDFLLVFLRSRAELEALLPSLASPGKYDCLFWVAYPKKSGKLVSDLDRDQFWTALSSLNLRPVTQIAIDDTWSALRFRPAEAVGK